MRSFGILLQHLLPHHLLSRCVLRLTRIRNRPVKNTITKLFMRGFRPDLSDAVQTDPYAYASFNEFFTRALRADARPLAGGASTLVSPVDGTMSQLGALRQHELLQAKGRYYTLDALLAGAASRWAGKFHAGAFATIYLAPYNYHRIHMPADGTLQDIWYVPGRLFSVNANAAATVTDLFARNERLILLFEGSCGAFAVIFVGALNVGSMATVWHGDVTPRRPRTACALPLPQAADRFRARGAEIGRFNMGSTVILLFERDRVTLNAQLASGSTMRMGQELGQIGGKSISSNGDWRPGASLPALQLRAKLLDRARDFFRARAVLEVETPLLVSRTVSDVQIPSLRLSEEPRYLHTSPEYAMKRLLAAGHGDIFQICKVFRAGERSALHNPEFTMIEWYRLQQDLTAIMAETAALVATLLNGLWPSASAPVETLSYRDAFQRELGVEPRSAPMAALADICAAHGLATQSIRGASRDELLDFLIAMVIGPKLGRQQLTCLHHYPASQAALAELDGQDPQTALRFELYAQGVELANGYVELADRAEQARRFIADASARLARGLPAVAPDERLLAALEHGLPRCAGVALGFDRVVMLALGAASIDQVLAFAWDRA